VGLNCISLNDHSNSRAHSASREFYYLGAEQWKELTIVWIDAQRRVPIPELERVQTR